jgi:hypothetical protein
MRQEFHVWHFVGRSETDHDRPTDNLYFESESGEIDPINASELGILLKHNTLRLVVLNT